jgi:RNA polymerase sigma-54 factor
MGMRPGLEMQMQQSQRVIMTHELRQAIAVLQLPVTELEDFIAEELLENPCMEVEPRGEAEPLPPSRYKALLDYLGRSSERGDTTEHDDDVHLEPMVATIPTLYEHLTAQLLLTDLDPWGRRIGEYLIGSLNDHGFMTMELVEIAAALAVPESAVLKVLATIQGFDPPGVGARTLQECLLLQWATLGDTNPLVPLLIRDHLINLGEGRFLKIAEELAATPVQVQEAADLIRTLDPKPGRRFGQPGQTRYVVPDVVVERVGRDYLITVNEAPIPRLRVSQHYRQLLDSGADPEARQFVEKKINAALWLIRSIEQRRTTLQSVTQTIVGFQRAFFDQGFRALRPLTLREVAAVVGVHESTVSRSTAGKYVQTPRGIFALKFFFSSGVEAGQGDSIAAESVKRLIADLIAKEEPTEPLSDQTLADQLGTQGVQISRRTVAKYREEMRVPSSGKRRRY